jgi:PAS domain S-box-containing protein
MVTERTDERIQQLEHRLHAIFEGTHDAMLIADDAGYCVAANGAAAELFGVRSSQLVGKRISDFASKGFDFEAAWAALLRDGVQNGELAIPRLDGTTRHAAFRATANIEPGHHLSVLRDITAQKAAERALHESDKRYRALVESSTDVVFVTYARRFRYVSPSVKALFGYEPSELVGKETSPLVHPEDCPVVERVLAQSLRDPCATAPVKFRARAADGSYRVVEAVTRNMLHEPSINGIVVTVRDVTERERHLEELRLSEARLRGIVDGALDAMLIANDEGRFIDLNAAALRLLGVERAQVIGKRMHEIFPGGQLSVAGWHRFLAVGHVERNVVVGSGEDERFLELRATANVYPGGHLAVLHDATARRKAEQALADSERRFRLLVESSADVVYISSGGSFAYVSPAITNVLGYAPEDLVGRDSLSLFHPDDRAQARCIRDEFDADPHRASAQLKARILHQDGRYRVVELVVRSFPSEPSFGGFVVNFHDVTERDEALEELRRSEASLRLSQATLEKAQAVARIGSWTIDGVGPDAVMDASAETLRIYGIDPATFDRNPWSFQRLVDPADWQNTEDTIARLAETGGSFSFDLRMTRADGVGGTRWVHIEGIVEAGADGRPPRLLGTTFDITATRRAEEELRASEARYRRIIETTSEGVWLVDAQRLTTFVNRRMAELLGYTASEMIGRTPFDFALGPVPGPALEYYEALERGASASIVFELRTRDGAPMWVSVASTPLFDERGHYDGALAMITDITERRRAERAERALRDTEEQLRQAQKLEALGQLAGGVAHDFNNILSVILGYTSILTQELPPNDPALEEVAEIHEAGLRASDLTRQLLAFSRKQVLQPRVVEVHGVVARTEKMLRRLLGEDIELQLVEPGKSTAVKADPGQLEQVIINLAVNARDAMPSGGRLLIETQRTTLSADEARQLGAAPGEYVALLLTDTGVGMDEAVRAHLFEPFFTTKEKGKGTGLGLSTVFGIVKQSAGHVTVTSKPGAGTTFRILLPATDAPAELVDATRNEAPATRSNEIVLLVEDEAQVRTLARNVLRRAGYRVLEAATPGEAILISEQHDGPIDLLLTDVVMPRMGGHALALRLRAQRPEMKVLYLSGYTDDTVLRHGVELGELAFLAKPFTPAVLSAKLRAVLDSDQPQNT